MLSTQPDPLLPCYTLYKYIPLYIPQYQYDWLYLQSVNSIKHQERRHLGFGVFSVIWSTASTIVNTQLQRNPFDNAALTFASNVVIELVQGKLSHVLKITCIRKSIENLSTTWLMVKLMSIYICICCVWIHLEAGRRCLPYLGTGAELHTIRFPARDCLSQQVEFINW